MQKIVESYKASDPFQGKENIAAFLDKNKKDLWLQTIEELKNNVAETIKIRREEGNYRANRTLLEIALEHKAAPETVKLFIPLTPISSLHPLRLALSKCESETIKMIIEATSEKVTFTLNDSIKYGASTEILQLLIDKGAPLNEAVIDLARTQGSTPEVIEFLEKTLKEKAANF